MSLASALLRLVPGPDYSVFLTGRRWDEAWRRPLREAVEVTSIRAAGHIVSVGLIPLLLSAFLVRQLLVPALILPVGRIGG